jgi:hypothetical protein
MMVGPYQIQVLPCGQSRYSRVNGPHPRQRVLQIPEQIIGEAHGRVIPTEEIPKLLIAPLAFPQKQEFMSNVVHSPILALRCLFALLYVS